VTAAAVLRSRLQLLRGTLAAPPASTGPGDDALPRPDRFPRLINAPRDARQVLADARVLVIGAGGVGRRLIDDLARLEVGGLDVVDPGVLAPENLATHPVGTRDLGQPKATSAGRHALDLSPGTRVRVAQSVAESLPLAAWFEPDLVLLASDHPAVEVEVGQRCLWAGKPLIHAAVHGDTLVAQVRVFTGAANGPCPACLFGAQEWSLVGDARRFKCDGSGEAQVSDSPPTRAPGFLCGLAADLALTEVLALLLELRPTPARLVEHCGYPQRTVVSPLSRHADCPCEHLTLEDMGEFDPARITPGQLAETAGMADGRAAALVTLAVEDTPFALEGACLDPACPARAHFIHSASTPPHCEACAGPARAHPFHQRDEVALRDLPAGLSFADLGLPFEATAVLRSPGAGALARLIPVGGHR
jgi:molybdopterin/thiamine biosynthesis adenylyltransferase